MVLQDLDYVFDTLDVGGQGFIEWFDLKELDESIYYEPLSIEQLEAAIATVCGPKSDGKCRKEYFYDLTKELERRHVMEDKIKWDFRSLDVDNVGRIPIQSALFLFKVIHGDRFSATYWKKFLDDRLNPEEDICLEELKLYLCNIPEFASANSNTDFMQLNKDVQKNTEERDYENYLQLQKVQEDDTYLAAMERKCAMEALKIKNNAEYLLNRLDEIGLQALLEDDVCYTDFDGRPIEKVTATELLNALKAKYNVLREKLLLQMLRFHIGEGMWETLSEHEQHEKLFQLILKEEKIRKDEKLDIMAIHFPGSCIALDHNLFTLMGESSAELEKRIKAEVEKINESGLPTEEVQHESQKKLYDIEKEKSTTEATLCDLNNRYLCEREYLSNKLQGLCGHSTMSAAERENMLFSIIQARLRGMQENQFESCGICIGLSERIQPQKGDRSFKDHSHHLELGYCRLKSHKSKRVHDGPTVPPKLFAVKNKLGRVDLVLHLAQECERRYALEREFLLNIMNTKECLMHRMSARKLSEDERKNQLSVLLAQWQGWKVKPSKEKLKSKLQCRRYFEEAVSLKFESCKEELHKEDGANVDNNTVSARLLALLQIQQDGACQKLLNVGLMEKSVLESLWKEQVSATNEEWFDNVAVVLFGMIETTEEEEELLKALSNKYDTLRDKLLMDALMRQYSDAEWEQLTEQERQNRLAKLKLLEKKLRREGKYDELAKLLGDAVNNSELLNKLLGENRQKYLNQLNERLRNRQRLVEAGEDPDNIGELIEESPEMTSGNLLRDLDKRFENERDELLRRLREENDRDTRERGRQAELARLRLEAHRANREANFDGAALVLGLAERNKAALEDRLKNDRARQEQLARERLAARRLKKQSVDSVEENAIEPMSDDISGWQECVIRELTIKQEHERNFFMDMLQEKDSEDLRQEARVMSSDERNERSNNLRAKRNKLDFPVKSDQEQHISILEMAIAIKYVKKEEVLKQSNSASSMDDVIISCMADLQQLQDQEGRLVMESLPNKTQQELVELRNQIMAETKTGQVENVATLVFSYEGCANDDVLVKALDKKYDVLLDKLALEALKKQMSDAEWCKLSEQERQAKLMKIKLEQRRLLREGKLDEAAQLLGDGFQAEKNLKKLMGENKKKYDDLLKQRLLKRREQLANGEPVDQFEDLPELEDESTEVDAKTLLADLLKRYNDEKEALLSRLHGADAQFMSERERQAELIQLKREQRRAEQEEKFGTAALVLGLAERNNAAVSERLKNDRTRHELLAKERLERLRQKCLSKTLDESIEVVRDGDLISASMKLIEKRHVLEQENLVESFQNIDSALHNQTSLLSTWDRTARLQQLYHLSEDPEQYFTALKEMVPLKLLNLIDKLTSSEKDTSPTKDDAIVTILADLQQIQDRESSTIFQSLQNMNKDELLLHQETDIALLKHKTFPNLPAVLSQDQEIKCVDENSLINALLIKYEALWDKLILDAFERKIDGWKNLSDEERHQELMKFKLLQHELKNKGKDVDADAKMQELLTQDTNIQSLLGATDVEREQYVKQKIDRKKKRQDQGLNQKEISDFESTEDQEFEDAITKSSTGNIKKDVERNFEVEKKALLQILQSIDSERNTDRQKQVILACLRRDARNARSEYDYSAVALVFALTKAIKDPDNIIITTDRIRQESLAKKRLQVQPAMKGIPQETSDKKLEAEILNTYDTMMLQDSVLKVMEWKHTTERDVLMKIMDQMVSPQFSATAKNLSSTERQTKLFELKEFRNQWRQGNEDPAEQMEIFGEAVPFKVEEMRVVEPTMGNEDVKVKLLADLQDCQDQETQYTIKDLHEKNPITMKQLIKIHQLARQHQWHDNIAVVLLGVRMLSTISKDGEETELLEALKDKYNALKEKIYEEALKAKFGPKWDSMLDKEKEEHIARMKANQELQNDNEELQSDLENVSFPGMEKLIGKTRARQEQKLKDRMERRKRAKAEGKNMDEIERDEEIEDENEENYVVKGTDLLKSLQDNFESEKDAIMASLLNRDTKELNERERQLALAKLRREKRRIKQEEKYDGAALVLNLAKQNKNAQELSYENERARQEQLARERIAAMRQKKQKCLEKSEKERLLEEESTDQKDDLATVDQFQREGTLALQDALLCEMEKKHSAEQTTLLMLLQALDMKAIDEARSMEDGLRNEKLNVTSIKRDKVKERSRGFLNSQPPEEMMSEMSKQKFNESLAAGRETMQNVIKNGLEILVGMKMALLPSDLTREALTEEVSVLLMADLQEKQTMECNAVMQAMQQCHTNTTERLRQEQRKARRAGWIDNIAKVLFGEKGREKATTKLDTTITEKELLEEEQNIQQEAEDQLKTLEEEMGKEKEKRLATMNPEDVDEFLQEMQRQADAKRSELQSQIARQREIAKQRLEEKRRRRDDKIYESDLASAMIANAQKRTNMLREKTMVLQGAQKDSLEERLRKRREDRKRRQQEEEQQAEKERQKAEHQRKEDDKTKQEEVESTVESSTEPTVVKKKKVMPPLPGGGMRREKTVVEQAAEISQNKKQEMINLLIREQTSLAVKISKEQSRQEEMVRQLREKRRRKLEAREQEAAAVLGLGERQKTIVEDRKKGERERQIGQIRERVKRMKNERTMGTKEDESVTKKSFATLAQEQPQELTEDEKMQRIAQEMERKFKEGGVQSVTKELTSVEEQPANPVETQSRGKLDEKTREQILKERQKSKKLRRVSNLPISDAPSVENEKE